MKLNVFAGILAAMLCIAPFAASALTADDVQAQIKSLLAKVAEMTAQIQMLQGQATVTTSVSSSSNANVKSRVCSLLARNLSQGSQGDDVRALQEFLQSQSLLTVAPTGYFGSLTSSALARWQASQGVESVGIVGPKTRDRLIAWCGTNANLTASPQQGSAPLTVTFTSRIGDGSTRPSTYDGQDTILDFGDGTASQWISCGTNAPSMNQACATPVSIQHTYAGNGTYTAILKKSGGMCAGGCPETVLAQAVIAVGTQACTKEYSPVCAMKQVVCIKAPCNPVPTTYSNTCMAAADGATYAYDGQCRATNADPSSDSQCKSWNDGCNVCSRSTPGGPAMCTLKACVVGTMARPYCTGYFGDSTNKTPTISGFSGPTTLKTEEAGTWTVKASDPEGQSLSYNITWGDEADYTASGLMTSLPVFTQTTTFTHTYSSAGTYAVHVSARDEAGKEASVTITVKVSGSAAGTVCTANYEPVCGRPSGCANTCAPGMMCTAICQLHDPLTYSNRCYLDAAGASYISAGACSQ
jgi:hypothetical protein